MFYLQDYVNWIVRDLNQPEMPELNNHDRLTTPRWVDLQIQIQILQPGTFWSRMPWHDVGVAVEGPAARDVARSTL